MKKKDVNVRELVNKYQTNCEGINAIADACEQELRERTEAETKEYEALAREKPAACYAHANCNRRLFARKP
jgi:hypothetical protein